MQNSQRTTVTLAASLILPCVAHAAPRSLRIGVMPIVGRTGWGPGAHNMAGVGIALSYSPWWHHTLDVHSNCMTLRKRPEQYQGHLGRHHATESFRQSQCSAVAGMSYRVGYPSVRKASNRVGLVVGIGAGYRRTTRYDRITWFDGSIRGSPSPTESIWNSVVSSRVGVEYMPTGTLSAGMYLFLTSSPLFSDEIDIEPAFGLLISGYFLI